MLDTPFSCQILILQVFPHQPRLASIEWGGRIFFRNILFLKMILGYLAAGFLIQKTQFWQPSTLMITPKSAYVPKFEQRDAKGYFWCLFWLKMWMFRDLKRGVRGLFFSHIKSPWHPNIDWNQLNMALLGLPTNTHFVPRF